MNVRRIAIGIDDYGAHPGINAAALEMARLARVNAISCMVGAPAWPQGQAALRALDRARVDIGLHLDLTAFPLRERPRTLGALLLAAYGGGLARAAILAEIEAQFDAFEQALGRSPDHVDGHQHVHQLPVVREGLLQAIARRHPACRPWLRCTRQASVGPAFGRFKAFVIASLGATALERLARAHGLAQNARLLGVHDFRADAAGYRALMQVWLQAAGEADLLMCHASLKRDAGDPIAAARRAEAQLLLGPDFDAMLHEAGVELAPISALRAQTR